ncbi:MAG: HAD-IA family hydrolase [bacterium]
MTPKIPLIAFIGLPNAGKSSLLNRITGTKKAVVAKEAHTTRDLNYGEDYWEGIYMRLVDTGGLVPDPEDKIIKEVQVKSWSAITEADLLVWVIDRKQNPDTISQSIYQRVWKTGKPFIIAINKVDDPNLDKNIADYAFLGANAFINLSCNTGYGISDLMDLIVLNLEGGGFVKNFDAEFAFVEEKKKRRSLLKTVRHDKDGGFVVIRNDDGLFESVSKADVGLESFKPKPRKNEIKNLIFDLSGTVFEGVSNKEFSLTKNFILEQKAAGKKVYFLTNAADYDLETRKDTVLKYFDGGVTSQEAGYLKPDNRIYLTLLKKYNLKPEESLYFDDLQENVNAGRELYINSVLFDYQMTNLDKELATVEGYDFSFPKVMFLGRPNVGKSSLFNAMVGHDVQIVTDIAGTTLSVNDTLVERNIKRTIEVPVNEQVFEMEEESEVVEGVSSEELEEEIEDESQEVDKFLIFDFDGVIGDTYNQDIQALIKFHNLTGDEAKAKCIEDFSKPREAKILDEKELKNRQRFHDLHASLTEEYGNLFEDFLLEILTIPNAKLAIVSNSEQEAIQLLLGDISKRFDFILPWTGQTHKKERIESICKDWDVSEQEVYYFTDTNNDILEVQEFLDPTKIIGCSWGFLGFDILKEVLPKRQILKKFSDFKKLFPTEFIEEEIIEEVEEDLEEVAETTFESVTLNKNKKYILLDSVGIRRPGQRTFGAETFATFRTIQMAHEADVICLVLDGSMSITHQDQVVAGILKEAGKGVVIVVNKADVIDADQRKKFIREFEKKFNFLKIEDFVWVSAEQRMNLQGIWNKVDASLEQQNKEISRVQLRKLFNFLMKKKPPQKLRTKKKAIIYDLLLLKKSPLTFQILVKDRKTLHWSYLRFVENMLRENFNLADNEMVIKVGEVKQNKVINY